MHPVRGTAALLALALSVAGCVTAPPAGPAADPNPVLEAWRDCVVDCDRSGLFYSQLVFVNLDGRPMDGPVVSAAPGPHWIEAHYSWGVGIWITGVGNYRNYGLEFNFVEGHRYRISQLPGGCVSPGKAWIERRTLRIEDSAGSAAPTLHEVPALEICFDGGGNRSCRSDIDCGDKQCRKLTDTSPFGLCGSMK